jgi:hypothetical protein
MSVGDDQELNDRPSVTADDLVDLTVAAAGGDQSLIWSGAEEAAVGTALQVASKSFAAEERLLAAVPFCRSYTLKKRQPGLPKYQMTLVASNERLYACTGVRLKAVVNNHWPLPAVIGWRIGVAHDGRSDEFYFQLTVRNAPGVQARKTLNTLARNAPELGYLNFATKLFSRPCLDLFLDVLATPRPLLAPPST